MIEFLEIFKSETYHASGEILGSDVLQIGEILLNITTTDGEIQQFGGRIIIEEEQNKELYFCLSKARTLTRVLYYRWL